MNLLRKCQNCKLYTIHLNCPKCGKKTKKASPPKIYWKHLKIIKRKIFNEQT